VADDTGAFRVLSWPRTMADVSIRWTAPGGEPCHVFRRGITPEPGRLRFELVPLPPGAAAGF
jgi:hypothetical protein